MCLQLRFLSAAQHVGGRVQCLQEEAQPEEPSRKLFTSAEGQNRSGEELVTWLRAE